MSDLSIQLTAPEDAERFAELAQLVISSHSGLTEPARAALVLKAKEMNVHPVDCETILASAASSFNASNQNTISAPVPVPTTESSVHQGNQGWMSRMLSNLTSVVSRPAVARISPIEDIIVDPSNPAAHQTIARALSAAAPGSRIRICPGFYTAPLLIEKAIHLVAEPGSGQVVIQTVRKDCIIINTLQDVSIDGLVLCAEEWTALKVQIGKPIVSHCNIRSMAGNGIWVYGPQSSPTMISCTIHSCRTGVNADDESTGSFADCAIFDNFQFGFGIGRNANPVVSRCKIYGNGPKKVVRPDIFANGGGVSVDATGKGVFEDCEFTSNFFDHCPNWDLSPTTEHPTFIRCKMNLAAPPVVRAATFGDLGMGE